MILDLLNAILQIWSSRLRFWCWSSVIRQEMSSWDRDTSFRNHFVGRSQTVVNIRMITSLLLLSKHRGHIWSADPSVNRLIRALTFPHLQWNLNAAFISHRCDVIVSYLHAAIDRAHRCYPVTTVSADASTQATDHRLLIFAVKAQRVVVLRTRLQLSSTWNTDFLSGWAGVSQIKTLCISSVRCFLTTGDFTCTASIIRAKLTLGGGLSPSTAQRHTGHCSWPSRSNVMERTQHLYRWGQDMWGEDKKDDSKTGQVRSGLVASPSYLQ